VIVVWNSAADAIGLIQSIEPAFALGLRAVIVDNGSIDGAAETMERFLEGERYATSVQVVRSGENLGFTGGVNFGVDAALAAQDAPDYIWLLNPDARTDAATMLELVAVAEASGAGIVGVRSWYMKRDAWPKPFWTWRSSHTARDAPARWWPIGEYFGCCVLFRTSLVRQLIARDGWFQDPGLFMDWDEWDCSLRARRLGAEIVMARDTSVEHDGGPRTLGPGKSAKFRQYYAARNAIVVSKRNIPARRFWPLFGVRLLRDATWFARLAVRRKGPHPGCYLLGTIDGFRGQMGRWAQHPAAPRPIADELPSTDR
jgi:GT2 family glycosyltransferase